MCVLTFIPTSDQDFVLTSNRDEAVLRKEAIPPQKYEINGQQVFYPKDPQGGGTWIASGVDFTLCLLNGGFIKHESQPPYKQSRGLVILDFFYFNGVQSFFNNYDFHNIEPFTLVIIDRSEGFSLVEIRWTGSDKHLTYLDGTLPHIWSSSTLYTHQIITKRQNWFKEFLVKNPNPIPKNLIDFHTNGGDGDLRNDIKMNRDNDLKTVSITQIIVSQTDFLIKYEDLIKNNTYNFRVFVEKV